MDILELVHDDERSEARPHVCSMERCSKAFSRRSDLARHERIHTNDRPYHCNYKGCGKDFIQRSALKVHIRVHTGERPHVCEVCSKAFADSSSLARHRRVHSGKRPYRCLAEDCGRTFCRKTTLTKHTRRNHSTDAPAGMALAVPVIGSSNPVLTASTDSSSTAMATKAEVRRSQRYKPKAEYAEYSNHSSSSVDGYSTTSYDDGSGCYSSSSFCSTPVHRDAGSPMSHEDTPVFYSPVYLPTSGLSDTSRHPSSAMFNKHQQQHLYATDLKRRDQAHQQQHPIPFVSSHPHSNSHRDLHMDTSGSTLDSTVSSPYSSHDMLSSSGGGSYSVGGFSTFSAISSAPTSDVSQVYSYADSCDASNRIVNVDFQQQHRDMLHNAYHAFE